MSLAYIGPVVIDFHGDPTFSWGSEVAALRARRVSIGGLMEWAQAEQLSELVDDPGRRVPYGEFIGVLEPVFSSDVYLSAFNGLYLLTGFGLSPEQKHSLPQYGTPISLSGLLLGAPNPRVIHSERAVANSFSVTPAGSLAEPYFGDPFVISPSGAYVEREYDPEPHVSARVETVAASSRTYTGAAGVLPSLVSLALADL